jgi:hypothetical protein
MKSKLLILGFIALLLASGLVLVSCTKCPGGGTAPFDVGNDKAKCSFSAGATTYKDCDDKCILTQATKGGGEVTKSLSCDCD